MRPAGRRLRAVARALGAAGGGQSNNKAQPIVDFNRTETNAAGDSEHSEQSAGFKPGARYSSPLAPLAPGAEASAGREHFEREGYTIYRNVLDAELVAAAGRHVEWLEARHPDTRPENLQQDLVEDDPFWLRLVSDPRLLDIAAQFVGDDIGLFASQ